MLVNTSLLSICERQVLKQTAQEIKEIDKQMDSEMRIRSYT